MATSAFTKNVTAGDVVRTVMGVLGLTQPNNVFESQDPNAIQLRSLLTRAGQRLLGEYDWQMLLREWSVTTVDGQRLYPIPEDLDRFTQDASWNRTTRLPAIGSLSEQEWQMLMARQLQGTTFTMLYRMRDGNLELYNTPSTVQTIVLPYVGRGWVRRADDSLSDFVSADTDLVLYDRQLAESALRLEWDIEKKFDTSASTQLRNAALAAAKAKDRPGRTLTLNRTAAYPYLGVINMPDTNYGSH